MNLEEVIKGRRSIRRYSEKKISKEVIEEIVEVARFAPSWKNSQVVRYHTVLDEALKNKISKECVLDFTYNAKTIEGCKALVVVTVLESISGYEQDGTFSTSQKDRWEAFDAGIATQTFCLAAHDQGIGSVILGIFDEGKIHRLLNITDKERVTALIALGYPLEGQKNAPPRKTPQELVTFY